MACDHTQPICRRCTKRRQEGECVYIISNDRSRAPSALRASSTPLASPRAPDPASPADYTRSPEPSHEIAVAAQPSVGYLGFTSYSSVFEETEHALGVTAATTTSSSGSNLGGASDASRRPSPSILEACLKILCNVPETSNGIALFREFPTPFDGFPHVVAKRVVRSLYETFGRYLGAQRNPRHLELVARKICANSSRPFSETEPDAEKWIAQFVGENIRWESLGILFTFWDLYQTEEGVPRYVYHHKSKFTGRVVAIRQSLKLCAEVCNDLGAANSLLLHVSQKLCVAESTYSGDASECLHMVPDDNRLSTVMLRRNRLRDVASPRRHHRPPHVPRRPRGAESTGLQADASLGAAPQPLCVDLQLGHSHRVVYGPPAAHKQHVLVHPTAA